jgi:acyl-CoA synthetase (AMP-forming)/AMP-acid ligase II
MDPVFDFTYELRSGEPASPPVAVVDDGRCVLFTGGAAPESLTTIGRLRRRRLTLYVGGQLTSEQASQLRRQLPWDVEVCGSGAAGMESFGRAAPRALTVSPPDLERYLPAPSGLFVRTSGSSGRPLLVHLSWSAVNFACAAIQKRLGYRADDRIGVYVPLSFDYGLYQLFLADDVGASVYLGSNAEAGPLLVNSLHDNRITVLPAVPTLIGNLLRLLRRKPHPLPFLRAITSTGEHLPESWCEELGRLLPHVQLFPMYGLTECKRVSIRLPNERPRAPGSVGRPLDGTSVRVVNGAGEAVGPRQLGEIVVFGPHLAEGYWNEPEETDRKFRRWGPEGERALFTGDYGFADEDGHLYVQGRRDSLVKHRGFRMSTLEIEEVARRMKGVEQAVAFHEPGVDRLVLIVSHSGPSESAREALNSHLRGRLEPHKLPDRIVFVDEMPRTPNGKLDRLELLQRFSGGAP